MPLAAAAGLGALAGLAPIPVAVLLVGVAVLAGLLLHLEWAAILVVATAVFEDYLASVDTHIVKGLAGVLVVAWVVRRCQGPLRAGRRSPVLMAALAFTAALAAATAVHNNGHAGTAVVLRYAGFIAVLLVLADVLRATLTATRLARWYVAACSAAAVCGLVTYVLGDDRRVGGPIGDPNDFAFFLLAALPLAPALRRTGRRAWPWDLAAVLIAVAIAGTYSRGALVGVAVMVLITVLTGVVRVRTAVGLLAAVGVALAVVVVVVPSLVTTSLEQKSAVADQNVSERLALWTAAARMTLADPVLGLGPGSFSTEHQDYSDALPDDVNHPLDVAHNTWLELSSELGVLGLLAFVAILVTGFREAWRARAVTTGPPRALAGGVCAGLVGTAAAATFVTEQYFLPLWLLPALAVGLAARSEAGGGAGGPGDAGGSGGSTAQVTGGPAAVEASGAAR